VVFVELDFLFFRLLVFSLIPKKVMGGVKMLENIS